MIKLTTRESHILKTLGDGSPFKRICRGEAKTENTVISLWAKGLVELWDEHGRGIIIPTDEGRRVRSQRSTFRSVRVSYLDYSMLVAVHNSELTGNKFERSRGDSNRIRRMVDAGFLIIACGGPVMTPAGVSLIYYPNKHWTKVRVRGKDYPIMIVRTDNRTVWRKGDQ